MDPFPQLGRKAVAFWCCLIAFGWLVAAPPVAAVNPSATPWALTPPTRPAVPVVKHTDWVQTPIDRFILARLEAAGLRPNPQADRACLLRRVYHDLTGLPPTAEEVAAFLADHSPDAYERIVDRLLASPRFGERWAQHWLDVVRYSETDGFKLDRLRPDAWRYRDYVIRAFNTDLPYDRFLRQQLAGDELEPNNPDALIATGYLRHYPEEMLGADYRAIRQDILNDLTDTFGSSVLGLTVGCARCHDHKADPITHADYYNLQSFFAAIGQTEPMLVSPTAQQTYREQLAAWEAATRSIRDEMDALVVNARKDLRVEAAAALDPETQAALNTPVNHRTPMQCQLATLGGKQITRRLNRAYRRLQPPQRARYDALVAQLAQFDRIKPPTPPTALAASDVGPTAPDVFRLAGGNLRRPKEKSTPMFPAVFRSPAPEGLRSASHPGTTGRRSALALWATQPGHPMTARVVMNRLWHHYFGRGIVATPSDFGAMGAGPTHPELLDWLACELEKGDSRHLAWSLKRMHRMIVTSAAYRQSSDPRDNSALPAAQKTDPDNRLFWRARTRRMDAEALHDAALFAGGALDFKMGGVSGLPILPAALADSRSAWTGDPATQDRRAVYLLHCRNLTTPLFKAFDSPSQSEPCSVRDVTVSANQALVLLNGEFAIHQARRVAGKVLASESALERVAAACYRRVLGREPDAEELREAVEFLRNQERAIESEGTPPSGTLPDPQPVAIRPAHASAVVDLAHALLNSTEFLYVE